MGTGPLISTYSSEFSPEVHLLYLNQMLFKEKKKVSYTVPCLSDKCINIMCSLTSFQSTDVQQEIDDNSHHPPHKQRQV